MKDRFPGEHFDLLHPDFRPHFKEFWSTLLCFADRTGVEAFVSKSYRSPNEQWKNYQQGRKLVEKNGRRVWVADRYADKKIITNATPEQSAHCKTGEDGKPASCAVDVGLRANGVWLPDGDNRWSIIPAAAVLSSDRIRSGAFFKSIRGGDWPHIELLGWGTL